MAAAYIVGRVQMRAPSWVAEYPVYGPLIALRQTGSDAELTLVEGL